MPDKKICGILAEACRDSNSCENVMIIGVGLNVNMNEDVLIRIDRPATSLLFETGKMFDVKSVLENILEFIAMKIKDWERDSFSALREKWCACDRYKIDDTISITDNGVRAIGVFAGIF